MLHFYLDSFIPIPLSSWNEIGCLGFEKLSYTHSSIIHASILFETDTEILQVREKMKGPKLG